MMRLHQWSKTTLTHRYDLTCFLQLSYNNDLSLCLAFHSMDWGVTSTYIFSFFRGWTWWGCTAIRISVCQVATWNFQSRQSSVDFFSFPFYFLSLSLSRHGNLDQRGDFGFSVLAELCRLISLSIYLCTLGYRSWGNFNWSQNILRFRMICQFAKDGK